MYLNLQKNYSIVYLINSLDGFTSLADSRMIGGLNN